MDRRLLLVYGIVLIDVVLGSAIGPVLPQFVSKLSQPQVWLSLGTALFLGVQLVSSPLIGKLSDSLGRRPLIITSTIGTLLANALPVRAGFLFANRFGDGLTNGMFATARSAVTDLSPKDDIVKNIGLVAEREAPVD
ncbi:MFS transporter [Spirosoma arcticum]